MKKLLLLICLLLPSSAKAYSIPPDCHISGYGLTYTAATNAYGCANIAGSGGSVGFDALISGTNTTAAMVVGSGGTLGVSGSGTIAATTVATINGLLTNGTGIGLSGSGTSGSPYSISNTGVLSFTGDSTIFNNSTSTGAVTASLATQTKNTFLSGPTTGSAATPTFRVIGGADLPNPSATTLGGIESIAAVTHNFLTSISTAGVPAQAQPAFSDISGNATNAQLASQTANTLLGALTATTPSDIAVPSCTDSGGNHLNWTSGTGFSCGTTSSKAGTVTSVTFTGDGIIDSSTPSTAVTTSGTVAATPLTQVKNTILSGPTTGANANPTFRALVGADLPNPSASTLGGVESLAAVSHNFLTSISTSGVPTQAQPAFTDISGQATNAQLATQTANTVLGALTATTPSGLALPSCTDTSGNHLNYTSGTGFSCGTSNGGVTSITGTANQVIASASTGAVTLSLPQSIATSSTPQFAGLGIGRASTAALVDIVGSSGNSGSLANFGRGNSGVVDGSISSGYGVGTSFEPFFNVTNNSTGVFGLYGFAGVNVSAGKTLNTLAGIYIDTSSNTGAGTVTNAYQLYIANPGSVGINNYALYSVGGLNYFGGNIQMNDGANFVLGSTTGTQIGTATSQKLGFFGVTPVVQQTGNIATALSTLGLVTSPTVTATTNANLTGPITSSGNATSIASQTGTGTKFVVDTSPTLVTPTLGAATATSVNFGQTSLSYYGEGTWTPAITAVTPGTPTQNVQYGDYTRIGREVIAHFYVSLSAWTGSPSGQVSITGLPFTSANTVNSYGSCFFQNYGVTGLAANNFGVTGNIIANTSVITMLEINNTRTSQLTAAQAGTTPLFLGTCFYHI